MKLMKRYVLQRRRKGWGIWDRAFSKWHTRPGVDRRADLKETLRRLNK